MTEANRWETLLFALFRLQECNHLTLECPTKELTSRWQSVRGPVLRPTGTVLIWLLLLFVDKHFQWHNCWILSKHANFHSKKKTTRNSQWTHVRPSPGIMDDGLRASGRNRKFVHWNLFQFNAIKLQLCPLKWVDTMWTPVRIFVTKAPNSAGSRWHYCAWRMRHSRTPEFMNKELCEARAGDELRFFSYRGELLILAVDCVINRE